MEAENSRWKILYKVSSSAALILGLLLLINAIGFIISFGSTEDNRAWYSILQTNWLIVIFKLHAGLIAIQNNPLHGLNIIDLVIMCLFSIMCFGLNDAFKSTSRIWSFIGFALSLIAIILFIATQMAGRSTIMLSVMIFSFVMLKNKIFGKGIIYIGILAGVFLFVGDLSVGIHSNIITILFGIGYVLLTIWFILIALKLIWIGTQKKESQYWHEI